MSRWVVDASLCLGWYLRDEESRAYNLAVLARLKQNDAVVPSLWVYEVANDLVMAHRRKRITLDDLNEIIESWSALPIAVHPEDSRAVLRLPAIALQYHLTAYDAAHLELALRLGLPIATKDDALKRAMTSCGISLVEP